MNISAYWWQLPRTNRAQSVCGSELRCCLASSPVNLPPENSLMLWLSNNIYGTITAHCSENDAWLQLNEDHSPSSGSLLSCEGGNFFLLFCLFLCSKSWHTPTSAQTVCLNKGQEAIQSPGFNLLFQESLRCEQRGDMRRLLGTAAVRLENSWGGHSHYAINNQNVWRNG